MGAVIWAAGIALKLGAGHFACVLEEPCVVPVNVFLPGCRIRRSRFKLPSQLDSGLLERKFSPSSQFAAASRMTLWPAEPRTKE